MMSKFFNKVTSCICLINLPSIDDLLIVYRSLIELFFTYMALWNECDEVIENYYLFDKETYRYNYGNSIPDDIKKRADELRINPVNYLNYGWIEKLSIVEENDIGKIDFSLKGLAKILDKKGYFSRKDYFSTLYKQYKTCNPQSHGTSLLTNYFQTEISTFCNISSMLGVVAVNMSKNLFDFELSYEGVNLNEELIKESNDSGLIYDWVISDTKNLKKTNEDFEKRIICLAKMRNV